MSERRILGETGEIRVTAEDERGEGHANHIYEVRHVNKGLLGEITFQKGPIQEVGMNGVQNEDLLAIIIDRLIGFQTGEFACEENEEALRLLIEAAGILQLRTAKRKARGVEGKNIK